MYVQKSWTSSFPNIASAVRKAEANVRFIYMYYVLHIICIYYTLNIQTRIRRDKLSEDSAVREAANVGFIHIYWRHQTWSSYAYIIH